jgi:hypothetical protein
LVNDRTRDEAQDQNALVSDGFVGDGDAHEASIVLFLPEVLDASGVTLSDLSSNANRRNNSP